MMDCGALPFCVPMGCSCALWRLLRVVAHGEFGQVCPFAKWVRVGGYDLAGHSPRLPYGVFSFPLLPSPFSAGLGVGRAGTYLQLLRTSSPGPLRRRDMPDPQRGAQTRQEVSIGGAVPLCFTRLEVTVRMPS